MKKKLNKLIDFIFLNKVDLLFLLGIILISIGSFKFNKILGFIVSGLMLIILSILLHFGGDEN